MPDFLEPKNASFEKVTPISSQSRLSHGETGRQFLFWWPGVLGFATAMFCQGNECAVFLKRLHTKRRLCDGGDNVIRYRLAAPPDFRFCSLLSPKFTNQRFHPPVYCLVRQFAVENLDTMVWEDLTSGRFTWETTDDWYDRLWESKDWIRRMLVRIPFKCWFD